MKKKIKWLILGLVVILIGSGTYYLTYSYPTTPIQQQQSETYNMIQEKDWLYFPGDALNTTAIVIYQGARVEPLAYSYLAAELQRQGYHVFISKMPLNWAFFNANMVDDMQERYPDIMSWYTGGHSLGGVMGSNYVFNHQDNPKNAGVFFLASYPAKDFSQTGIPMLGIFGAVDGLVTEDKRNQFTTKQSTSPLNETIVIAGGNHAQFGVYGAQKGDNTATISVDVQQQDVAEALVNWIKAIADNT